MQKWASFRPTCTMMLLVGTTPKSSLERWEPYTRLAVHILASLESDSPRRVKQHIQLDSYVQETNIHINTCIYIYIYIYTQGPACNCNNTVYTCIHTHTLTTSNNQNADSSRQQDTCCSYTLGRVPTVGQEHHCVLLSHNLPCMNGKGTQTCMPRLHIILEPCRYVHA